MVAVHSARARPSKCVIYPQMICWQRERFNLITDFMKILFLILFKYFLFCYRNGSTTSSNYYDYMYWLCVVWLQSICGDRVIRNAPIWRGRGRRKLWDTPDAFCSIFMWNFIKWIRTKINILFVIDFYSKMIEWFRSSNDKYVEKDEILRIKFQKHRERKTILE